MWEGLTVGVVSCLVFLVFVFLMARGMRRAAGRMERDEWPGALMDEPRRDQSMGKNTPSKKTC